MSDVINRRPARDGSRPSTHRAPRRPFGVSGCWSGDSSTPLPCRPPGHWLTRSLSPTPG